MQKIYTRTGDAGTTALIGGKRVSKNSGIIRLLGELDELNSMLGLTKVELALREVQAELHFSSQSEESLEKNASLLLERIQHELFKIGDRILFAQDSAVQENSAVFDENTGFSPEKLVQLLEKEIDQVESRLPPLKSFVIPGGNRCSALLHVTRTICRRTERSLVALVEENAVQLPHVLAYFNRLGDLLFLLARELDARQLQESGVVCSC